MHSILALHPLLHYDATPEEITFLELHLQQNNAYCFMDTTFNFTMSQEDQLALAMEWEEQMMMEADEFLDDEHRE
jgi:hypothetical protein